MAKKKKGLGLILKKKLHPLLSYAVLFGIGAIAVSTTGSVVGVRTAEPPTVPVAAAIPAKQPLPAADLTHLQAAALDFSAQLSVIKSQIAELEKYGRTPSAALLDAIGQGDQLTAVIAQANTLADIGEPDAAAKLQAIGSKIAANSKF